MFCGIGCQHVNMEHIVTHLEVCVKQKSQFKSREISGAAYLLKHM